MSDYLARNRLWQSPNLQTRLAEARVVIAGVGGLGWQIGAALIGLGVRTLHVFDPDRLETVNLNRLWGCRREDIGSTKVGLFADLATSVNDGIDIHRYAESVPCESFERALDQADVVFGGFDRPEPRLATQLLAIEHRIVYVDSGVLLKKTDGGLVGSGQVFVYRGEESSCILCAGLRLSSLAYLDERSIALPSSGMINGIVSHLAVSTWVKMLSGEAVPELLHFDWNRHSTQSFERLPRNPNCPICTGGTRAHAQ